LVKKEEREREKRESRVEGFRLPCLHILLVVHRGKI
jgi:hypothetical protein